MFSKASIVAIFASFAAAQHAAVGNPSGNPITRPLNEVVPACKAFTITWTPTTYNTVSLILLRGPSTNVVPLGAPLAVGIPNSGSFTWTPASTLEADVTHYGLQLIDDVNGQYQYSTQFGISKDACSVASSSAAVVASSSADNGYGYASASSSAAVVYSTPAAITKSVVSSLSPPYPTTVPGTGASYNSTMVIKPTGSAPGTIKPSATSSTNGTALFTGAADAKQAGLTFVGAFAALAYFL